MNGAQKRWSGHEHSGPRAMMGLAGPPAVARFRDACPRSSWRRVGGGRDQLAMAMACPARPWGWSS